MSVIYSIGRGTARERTREREMASQVKIGDWFIELDTSSLGIIFFFISELRMEKYWGAGGVVVRYSHLHTLL